MNQNEPFDDFWSQRNVFVTGCSGFLGSWLTQELVERGANVVGLVRDRVPASRLWTTGLTGKMTTVIGEIENVDVLDRALSEYEIDSVFHLAAQPIVGVANRNPLGTFEANIRGTWNVLEACRRNKALVKRIICASSDKAYGTQPTLPYDERMPLQGEHPYDVSKTCSDLLARTYYVTYGLPVCITRCGNFYGGGDLNFNRIVPGTIRSVLRGERPVIRSDGSFIRDYIFVRDAVDGYLQLASKMDDTSLHGEAFNFSDELQISVLQLTSTILRLMNRDDLSPVILNEASGEIKHQYLSAQKARTMLNWKPLFGLEDGLCESIKWYTDFLNSAERAKADMVTA